MRRGFIAAVTLFVASGSVLAASPAFAADVTVQPTVSDVGVTPTSLTRNVGDTFTLTYTQGSFGTSTLSVRGLTGSVSSGGTICNNSVAPGPGNCNLTNGQTQSFTVLSVGTLSINAGFIGTLTITAGGGGGGGGGGSSSSSSSAPSPVFQQFGKPASGTCDAAAPATLNWAGVSSGGWGESWSEWMNGGLGGAVCTRTLVYSDAAGAWTVA